MGFVILWIICAFVGAALGSRKGRGGTGFILGLLFGPIGILIVLVIRGNRRSCSACKELIHKAATRCPHCQYEIVSKPVTAPPQA